MYVEDIRAETEGLHDAVDRVIRRYETSTGPMIGARAVARAPGAIQGTSADSWGLGGRAGRPRRELRPAGGQRAGRAQHGRVHALLLLSVGRDGVAAHLVQAAGLTARARSASRGAVLAEFGHRACHPEREVRVWDSSAELRYMVLPMPPGGAERLAEDDLARHITREALIGVAEVSLTTPPRGG